MMVTANRIPVPDPIAPRKSARTVNIPMHMPPKEAATGMYLFRWRTRDVSRCPFICNPWFRSILATSRGDCPETFRKRAEKENLQ